MSTTRSRSRVGVTSSISARIASPTGFISAKLEGHLDPVKGGHSVHARAPIQGGETLVVWGGEVVTEKQLLMLPREVRQRLCLQVEEDLFLLTSREGPSDWVNHSCEPNAGLRGQIVLVALRDIEPGEEICFDYAMCDSHPYCEFDCHCGAERCRGRVSGEDWRIPELQERYRGFFSSYLERIIAESPSGRLAQTVSLRPAAKHGKGRERESGRGQ